MLLSLLSALACHNQSGSANNSATKVYSVAYADVSTASLVANPGQYEGKKIRTIGYLHLQTAGASLYLHKQDYDQKRENNALWIALTTPAAMDSLRNFADHSVIVEGVFDSQDRGESSVNSGSIKDITRVEFWPRH